MSKCVILNCQCPRCTIKSLKAKVEEMEKERGLLFHEKDKDKARIEELEERERWIPVTERLPDTDQPLHVMIKARRAGQELYVTSLSYLPAYGGFDHHYDPVIAWKPINPPEDV